MRCTRNHAIHVTMSANAARIKIMAMDPLLDYKKAQEQEQEEQQRLREAAAKRAAARCAPPPSVYSTGTFGSGKARQKSKSLDSTGGASDGRHEERAASAEALDHSLLGDVEHRRPRPSTAGASASRMVDLGSITTSVSPGYTTTISNLYDLDASHQLQQWQPHAPEGHLHWVDRPINLKAPPLPRTFSGTHIHDAPPGSSGGEYTGGSPPQLFRRGPGGRWRAHEEPETEDERRASVLQAVQRSASRILETQSYVAVVDKEAHVEVHEPPGLPAGVSVAHGMLTSAVKPGVYSGELPLASESLSPLASASAFASRLCLCH